MTGQDSNDYSKQLQSCQYLLHIINFPYFLHQVIQSTSLGKLLEMHGTKSLVKREQARRGIEPRIFGLRDRRLTTWPPSQLLLVDGDFTTSVVTG